MPTQHDLTFADPPLSPPIPPAGASPAASSSAASAWHLTVARGQGAAHAARPDAPDGGQ
jgi:hypothetical protein